MRWAIVLVVLAAGCGTGLPQVDPESPRLQVTPALLRACEGDSTEVQIRGDLVAGEADRLLGVTWTEQTIGVGFVCGNDDRCAVCFQAIIDQIYGVDQGAPAEQVNPAPPLTVFDAILEACPDFERETVLGIIETTQNLRLAGITFSENVDVLDDVCERVAVCRTCFLAIFEWVYFGLLP